MFSRELDVANVKQAFAQFQSHQMTDRAASLTYYVMMSLFPGLLLVISIFGIVGDPSLGTRAANYLLDQGVDSTTADAVRNVLAKMTENSGGAGISLVVGLLLGLNGASGAFGAAGRALNVVHHTEDDRSFVGKKVSQIGWTAAVVALFAVTIVALFLGGGVARDLFGTLGLGNAGATIWMIARWPVALLSIVVAFGIVYAYAPDVEPRRWRWITPGAAAGVLIWVLASIGFSVYVSNFSSYGAAYGAAGAVIVLLLWLWLTANALLFGAELNKAIERRESAGLGGPPVVTPPPSSPQAPAPRAR